MLLSSSMTCTAFDGDRRIASGTPLEVAVEARRALDRQSNARILIFADATGEQVELDLRGTVADVRERLPHDARPAGDAEERRRPGRPKLGVVAREVTLLPRHWEWLARQPGGASVALRKLVEEARRDYAARDEVRRARETAYRFMNALGGNLAGFEEAARALFAGNRLRFDESVRAWPQDIRTYALRLAAAGFDDQTAAG